MGTLFAKRINHKLATNNTTQASIYTIIELHRSALKVVVGEVKNTVYLIKVATDIRQQVNSL